MPNKSIAKLLNAITAITGRFSWSCPPWCYSLARQANSRPGLFWGSIGGLIALLLLSFYGYHWYQHRPHPQQITAVITTPKATPNTKVLVPDLLSINFVLENTDTAKSVAPLNLIGKTVSSGITLSPAFPGKWTWQNDNLLQFTPEQDWPAGQKYTVEFDRKVFAAKTRMASLSYSFSTNAFTPAIEDFKFYQDPVNPQLRQAVATINFNYPVDTNSFESHTSLTLEGKNSQSFKYSVTYDEHKRTAYLRSEPLPLPNLPHYLELKIDDGVKTTQGAESAEPLTQKILIPDAGSYFKISRATANIIRNDRDRPEQILTLETTLGVKESELNKSLHVYLLPQNYPATATEEAQENYQWQNPGEITADILALSKPVDLTTIPADRDYATLHSYRFSAPAPRFIYLKIDKGSKSFGDYTLTHDFTTVIKVPVYPQEVSFLHKGALLALSSEKKLSVLVRGLPAVKFEIARVLPDNVNQLVTQTIGDFSQPSFINDSFNQQNISEIFSSIQRFDATDPAKEQYTALDIGKYLSSKNNTSGPQGLFLLQATGWDTEKDSALDAKTSRLILVTDLGLLIKDDSDGSHEVFVQSIVDGTPRAEVSVSILGKNGVPILTRMTDAQGHATFPTVSDFIDERTPTVYTARLGNDVTFIPFNNADRQLNYSRYDIGGIVNNQEVQSLSAYLFSDRGIYRPGDMAHIGMVVKQAYASATPVGLPVEATVTDTRGNIIQDEKFNLDATGLLTLDVQTNATSPTGQYTINLYIVRDNHAESILGSTTIQVADFQPDRLRIKANLSQPVSAGWISPDDLSAKVGLWNLYGAPATNRKVSAKIVLTPKRVQFDSYPSYIFIDPLTDPNKPAQVFTDTLADATTNDEGQAQFDLNLKRFEKATYELTFFAEGFEAEGGRSVTTQTKALVSPLAYLIGYKADGDLNYIKQNTARSVNFIAINPQLKQMSLDHLRIQLIALHPVTTLVKNEDGTYQYQSIIQSKTINTAALTVTEAGVDFPLATQDIGDFAVSVLDQNNVELSRFKYSIVGASQLPLAKNAELSVKLNKTEYHAGDDIELQITAPYNGSGLITIERDKVYASQWFKSDTSNSVQKIHIPADFKGNGYVNVAFVRDWNSPEIFISPLSYSVVPFTVNHDDHAIHIELTTPDLARPGENFTIQYKSDKPGKIIVFAIDEGILQVANYKTPDPLGFFFQKHALEVITQQTVDQILPKFMQQRELSAVGGDMNVGMLRNNLNPFKRKTDLPVVFWSGIIETDSTSRQLVYPLPDYFNGTLHVMAVAVAADAVGSAEKTSEIRGDFVINPNVPTFVAPGDEFEISASIANNIKNSGKDAKISVDLSATPQLKILGATHQSIVISEGQEQTVRFKLRATNQLDNAELVFSAKLADKSSKMKATLSVRPATTYLTLVKSGSADAATQSIALDRVMYPEFQQREATISTSPLILVYGLERYLTNFPFGCTEQLTSKALPLLAVGKQAWFADAALATNKIAETVRAIGQRQMSSGAFSYWPSLDENESNDFATLYAMHFLTEAREQGYSVPNDMFNAGVGYLKDFAAKEADSLEQARLRAYAIYLLTRNEIVTTSYLTNLQLYLDQDKTHAWRSDITSAYMAATYQLLKSDAEANRLIGYYQSKPIPETDFNNQAIDDAEYLYLLAKHFPDRLTQQGDKLVMTLVDALNTQMNTVLSGYSSLALGAYGSTIQSSNVTFAVNETLSNGQQQNLAPADSNYVNVNIDELAKKINFVNSDKQHYFYQIIQSGFDKNPPQNIIKQGLEVTREYRDAAGQVITEANLGSDIEVHIQLRALNDNDLSNIVIVDLLPGGFEVVRDSINTENLDYADAREDRVIFFGSAGPNAKEIVYKIKAINAGKYTIAPIFAGSMYDQTIKAQGLAGSMQVVHQEK